MAQPVRLQHALGALGKNPQQRVAGIVAVLIVDLLEVVQVDEQQRQTLVAVQAAFVHGVGEHAEMRAIAGLGQAVGPGDLLDTAQRGGVVIVQRLHVQRQAANFAADGGFVECGALAQQQVGQLVVELADGGGDVAADQQQQQADGNHAHQRATGEECQAQRLQTLGEVFRGRGEACIQRARQQHVGGQLRLDRSQFGGNLQLRAVFVFKCLFQRDEGLRTHRQLQGEGFATLAGQWPAAGCGQDEIGLQQKRAALGLLDVDHCGGLQPLLCLPNHLLLDHVHAGERRQAAFEVVGRLAVRLNDGDRGEGQLGGRQRADGLLDAQPEGVVAKGGIRLAQECQQRLAFHDRVEHAAVEGLVVQIGRFQRGQLLRQAGLFQIQQCGPLGQVGGGRGNQLDDQNDRKDHQQGALTERHGRLSAR